MNRKTSLIIFGILIVFTGILTIYYLSNPEEPQNIEECKLMAWTDCGLPKIGNSSEWCYQVEGKNSTTYENCTIISQHTADCWINASNYCFNKFIVEPAEREKNKNE